MESLYSFRDLLNLTSRIGAYEFPILMFLLKAVFLLFLLVSCVIFIYDRYIQRENQLLINYPLIGRLRYIFYALRDPMRQYFGDEKFYESFDKVKWVYDSAEGRPAYTSFSPGQPQKSTRLGIKNANCVFNTDAVQENFHVEFGKGLKYPFRTNSIFGRSAMSDGAISPEGTRAFAKGAYLGAFPINTGEGGLSSNFLYTHQYNKDRASYLEIFEGSGFAKTIYKIVYFLVNEAVAERVYRDMVINSKVSESYLFDRESLVCFRVNWDLPLKCFPKEVPEDIPDIILQIGSGLYGVRDKEGQFDEDRYKKSMCFAKMTEIKMAQGAKQTGGKLLASKVSEAVAYYRGIEPHKDLFSPNQFPYGATLEELFDFIGKLKDLSKKPVGVKIVISSAESFQEYADLIKQRVLEKKNTYPDFITIDGGEGGSGAAPLEMMMSVGMGISKAVFVAQSALVDAKVRENVKLIASEKVLTPDDAIVLFGLGADFVAIARAFMMSAGCIRARECSGSHGRACPVGLATQDKRKRASFLVEKKAKNIASYHQQLLKGIRNLLAIIGLKEIKDLNESYLVVKDESGKISMDVKHYFQESLL